MAHTQLIRSDPAAGSSLDQAPAEVSLVFNEDVEPQFATVTVAVGAGQPAEVPSRVRASEVVADVPPGLAARGTPGETTGWQVAYRVVSGDGHPITGTVDFTVTTAEPAPTAPAPSTAAGTTVGTQPAPETSTAAPMATLASDADQTGGWSIGQVLGVAAAVLGAVVVAVLLVARRRRDQRS